MSASSNVVQFPEPDRKPASPRWRESQADLSNSPDGGVEGAAPSQPQPPVEEPPPKKPRKPRQTSGKSKSASTSRKASQPAPVAQSPEALLEAVQTLRDGLKQTEDVLKQLASQVDQYDRSARQEVEALPPVPHREPGLPSPAVPPQSASPTPGTSAGAGATPYPGAPAAAFPPGAGRPPAPQGATPPAHRPAVDAAPIPSWQPDRLQDPPPPSARRAAPPAGSIPYPSPNPGGGLPRASYGGAPYRSSPRPPTRRVTLRHYWQRLSHWLEMPRQPVNRVVDGCVWVAAAAGLRFGLKLLVLAIPALQWPVMVLMFAPAIAAAYLALCVPQANAAVIYRLLLVTLGLLLGGKLG